MATALDNLTGLRKAAILMVTLGADASASIMRQLDEHEIEELTIEISKIRELTPATVEAVLEEFSQLAQARSYIVQGGVSYAREVLLKAVGNDRTDEILDRLQVSLQPQLFGAVRKTDPKHLSDFIRREEPQTIALILANLEAEMAAQVITHLPPEVRIDVVQRLATMEMTSPEVIKQIDQVLERRLATLFSQEVSILGGAKAVAEILNRVDRTAEKQIFEGLEPANPQLAEEIRRLMFTFDDIARLDDRSMQRLLKEVDQKDLARALKAAAENVAQKIFANLSERAQTMLRQEIEYLGPVRLRDVEDAQGKIVRIVRGLEEAGEIIVLGKQETGDVFV
ncbi:MAG TPA: flagellar motor switch protein FliG [Solirubrobacteraceae bacterium]|jgi:flagellar motor switch protein FliG